MYKLFKQEEDLSWILLEDETLNNCNNDSDARLRAEILCNGIQYRVEKTTEIGTTILKIN